MRVDWFADCVGTEYLKIIKPILEDMNGVSFECKTGYSFEVNPAMAGMNRSILSFFLIFICYLFVRLRVRSWC